MSSPKALFRKLWVIARELGRHLRLRSIDHHAARWLMHVLDRPKDDTLVALDRWLAADPRHQVAFVRMSLAWGRVDDLLKRERLCLRNDSPLTGCRAGGRFSMDVQADKPLRAK
jgi:ferric-dicitrate binding protein FerR (iron transport regulator)